ncbi:hypothetical protein IEQ34_013831 [Dendrobium chrysotoxum]|uniref:Uncharacterized protein n=1 Tax=Dendrobium chrysotoxum TaxID=161865 RepID=A0AAV7GPK3_DENCH|nr:hypothetical protein IEQ34_013831 [Dendrobium chrysotoxum]
MYVVNRICMLNTVVYRVAVHSHTTKDVAESREKFNVGYKVACITDEEEKAFAIICSIGITQRVQLQVGRKRKLVETPFTHGQGKGKINKVMVKKPTVHEEKEPAATKKPAALKEKEPVAEIIEYDTKPYVAQINKESIRAANLMLVRMIYNYHWTLIVRSLKNKVWQFYDSLPKKAHKAMLPQVVSKIL